MRAGFPMKRRANPEYVKAETDLLTGGSYMRTQPREGVTPEYKDPKG